MPFFALTLRNTWRLHDRVLITRWTRYINNGSKQPSMKMQDLSALSSARIATNENVALTVHFFELANACILIPSRTRYMTM
jgi:hypothetical protein